jgi:hypothetical protein
MMTRIYAVHVQGRDSVRLVRAPNRAAAIRHVAADTISADVASQDVLIVAVKKEIQVEETGLMPVEAV